MSPPAIVVIVIRPRILIIEFKEMAVWAVCIDKCTFFIAILILIDTFCVHPFIKGTAVIKYTVKDNSHPFFMHFFYEMNEKLVTCLKIAFVCDTGNIFTCVHVIIFPVWKCISLVHNNFSIMRVNIIVILNIIFMIGW